MLRPNSGIQVIICSYDINSYICRIFVCICFGIVLLFTVPLYPNLIDLASSASTLLVNYIDIKDFVMDTKKTNDFGIWGEMGERVP